MAISFTPISEYRKTAFESRIRNGKLVRHDIYARGEGPPVLVIQELPGIGPENLRLADRLVEAGFQVYLPHLFGPLEMVSLLGNTVRVFCMYREFSIFSNRESSPVVDWLRALCRQIREETGYPGVGAIGMCLTGNFAIALMADENVLAAVASQPSLPIYDPDGIHLSPEETAAIRKRLEEVGPMHSYRFDGDKVCPAARFAALANTFNDDSRERIRLHTLPGNGHSVLTLDFVDQEGHPTYQALQEVIGYFRERLLKT